MATQDRNVMIDAVKGPPKIVASNISKIYKVKQEGSDSLADFYALQQVSLTVVEGEFLTIVGPSGCGKSTFLDMIAGLSFATSGDIHIDGKRITGPALDRGIVLQGYALFPWRTVRENVEFGLEIKKIKPKERAEISERYLDLVGLKAFKDRYPYELSGGMKQRVAIARALAYDPEVLLMDEPFAALDAQTREVLQEELLNIWEKTKKTIIFVTHSIDEAVFLADRVAVMTANPGTIKTILKVDLKRPRQASRASAEFGWIRHKVWELLYGGPGGSTEKQGQSPDVADAISSAAVL
ncbi:MAG: ABC transporter ATP-binding protein [Negativicutes bacterium]|nr:ABC transporter ATP-binding protein [Negativicutes bacterium]